MGVHNCNSFTVSGKRENQTQSGWKLSVMRERGREKDMEIATRGLFHGSITTTMTKAFYASLSVCLLY